MLRFCCGKFAVSRLLIMEVVESQDLKQKSAQDETRTHTPEPALPPQSSVYTNFTTCAKKLRVPKTGLEPAQPCGH